MEVALLEQDLAGERAGVGGGQISIDGAEDVRTPDEEGKPLFCEFAMGVALGV